MEPVEERIKHIKGSEIGKEAETIKVANNGRKSLRKRQKGNFDAENIYILCRAMPPAALFINHADYRRARHCARPAEETSNEI
jgi:hypothetical protein